MVLCYFCTVSFYIPVTQVATSQTVYVCGGEDGGGRGLPSTKPDPHPEVDTPQLSNPR